MNRIQQPNKDRSEIRLKELLQTLWNAKWLVFAVTFTFTLAAAIAAFTIQKSYKATVVLSPSTDTSKSQFGSLGELASQLGGTLSSLTGLSASMNSRTSETLAVLESEALTEKYIDDNHLMPVLYERDWDAVAGHWRPSQHSPTLWEANRLFKNRIRLVTTDTKTGLITLTITWKDPKIAADWANGMVKMTNDYLRSKAIQESEKNIAYLNEQASRTDAVGIKEAIYSLLQTEISKVMLAKGNDEYAFKIIDPAVVPEQPSSPQKALWVVIGLITGLSLSAFGILLRLAWD